MNLKGLLAKKKAGAPKAPAEQRDPRKDSRPMAGGRRAGENSNPWLNARRTWNNHVDSVAHSRFMWWAFGMACLLVALTAVGGVIKIGSQSKFIPSLVVVDELGKYLWAGTVERSAPVPPKVIKSALEEWVCDARLVTPDVALQRKAILHVFSMLSSTDPAAQKMNEHYAKNEPFGRAAKEAVSCEVNSALPQTNDTWQIDWTETVRDRQGQVVGQPFRMRTLVTMYVAPVAADDKPEPTSTGNKIDKQRLNPLNVFVRDFSWSKQQ